jgi:hypothetical protein
MKIPEFKRSGIGIIAEFRGILNGFQNQVTWASVGTVTNVMLKSISNNILTTKVLSTVLQRSGFTEHCITASGFLSIEKKPSIFEG